MKNIMIYGATGYTGGLVTAHAMTCGVPLIIAGRDESKLAAMAAELNIPYRAFSLAEPEAVSAALKDVAVVLNCAGPFMYTANALMRAAVNSKTHYLDVAAEPDSYRLAEALDADAAAAGVMLLPGCGGSVAMLGCLAAHAAERISAPKKIALALNVAGSMSRGSAISATENLSPQCLKRSNGRLIPQEPTQIRRFDFGVGPVECFPVTLPDLTTVWMTTKIPDVETFVHLSDTEFPQGDLSLLADGPTEQERLDNRYQGVAEVVNAKGDVVRMLLETVNGYSFTAMAAAEAARRVLAGEAKPGFQTPAGLFGKQFAETIADTRITEI